MGTIEVIASGAREGWTALVDPPGEMGTSGLERPVFGAGPFTTGLWEREPDTWSFERPHHEVALILAGEADIEEPDGTVHTVRAGDVLLTPQGAKGTWHIREKIVKFWAIYDPNAG
jgi:uncharacterized cupin superfamily protein